MFKNTGCFIKGIYDTTAGALTLALFAKKTAEALELENSSIYLWTDSMVVIG